MSQTSPGRALGVLTATPTLDGLTVGGTFLGTAQTIDLGQTATDLVGFHGAAAIAQASALVAVGTSAPVAACAAFGFTSTQASAIITAVNALITALKNKGLTA